MQASPDTLSTMLVLFLPVVSFSSSSLFLVLTFRCALFLSDMDTKDADKYSFSVLKIRDEVVVSQRR
ncbi:unnamed protein product [Urochloa humidicola]